MSLMVIILILYLCMFVYTFLPFIHLYQEERSNIEFLLS